MTSDCKPVSGLASAAESGSAIGYRLFALFKHFLKLTSEHSSVVATKRDMEPVSFFPLDDELCRIGEICCTGSVLPRLRDYVDHQVPGSRLP